jgi:ABC-type phosphate/phosphonate transport system substrate-binding protein
MIASLPMYDLPEIRWATDAFWHALSTRLKAGEALTRITDWSSSWHSPDLLFSQTCGYPFTHEFSGKLTYVATPHYAADGCDGPHYRSILFARDSAPLAAFRGQRAVINNPDSMSGMLALKLAVAPLWNGEPFFSVCKESGSHAASLAAVEAHEADVCAIDCVTIALLRKHRPAALAQLVEIGRTLSVPGLPYVTRTSDVASLRQSLQQVMADTALAEVRNALCLAGLSVLAPDAYAVIPALEQYLPQPDRLA